MTRPLAPQRDEHGGGKAACPLCGGAAIPLPVLGPPAMLSDGRRVPIPLRKASCLACGAAGPVTRPDPVSIRAAFDADYALGERTDPSASARGAAYAGFILAAVGGAPVRSVFDAGCGAGRMLAEMAERLPGARSAGAEASERLAAAAAASNPAAAIQHGFAEDLAAPEEPFDLVCSVNVIEHTADPALFLRALARQAAPDGRIAVVCPRGDVPNLELVFFDHVHSFGRPALERLASAAGLHIIEHRTAPAALGDFQLVVLGRGEGSRPAQARGTEDHAALAAARARYLRAWANLDEALAARLPEADAACFGAGEAAALLRAYAPNTWARVDHLLVDGGSGAWSLDRPVRPYPGFASGGGRPVMLGVHPARQGPLADRLRADGWNPVGWPAGIER